jgi:hypothetical protein
LLSVFFSILGCSLCFLSIGRLVIGIIDENPDLSFIANYIDINVTNDNLSPVTMTPAMIYIAGVVDIAKHPKLRIPPPGVSKICRPFLLTNSALVIRVQLRGSQQVSTAVHMEPK